ncbi:MFS transporter [Actinoallomurus iriomotensis]|uniref:MFS transporter n=1 Tax=Actinoallomurus iriomotensis TaxID=478107 RepID=A0A9W6RWP4_9ACTN|nr:MFS transporter [Actinoallomurus iriomotensis]GLY83179.1 MFS transporter [Actinoallomurus iriomotensis]
MDASSRRAERLLTPAVFITSLGNNIQVIAASLLLVRAEGSMLAVGWLFIAMAVPQALLSPFFGRLADRVDRRLLWLGCDLAGAAAALALPVGVALGGPRDLVVYGAGLALAVANALFVPAGAALIKERVPAGELRRFNANYEIAMQAGMLLSGSIGGFAVQWFGAMPLFVFNAATFAASAICVFALGRGPARPAPARPSAAPYRTSLPGGTGRLILLYAQTGIVITVFNALLPILVVVELRRGSGVLGVVDALGGTGFLFAAAAYRVIGRRVADLPIAIAGLLLTGVGLVLQPLYGVASLVPCVLVGASLLGQARIASRALLLTSVAESQTGRLFGLANGYGLAGTVVVMLGVSEVTDHSGSRYGFATLAVITTAATLLVLVASLLTVGRARRPEPPAPLVPAEQG